MNEDSIPAAANTAQQYAGEAREKATQTAEQLRDQAQHYAGQVRDQAQQVASQVRDQAQRAYSESDQYVRQNPWTVVLGAAGLGLLVGYALAQRHEPSLRDRYVSDPLDHARDALYSILAPVATRVQKEYGHARSALEDAAENFKDVDPAKQASRLGRKLRFW